MIEQVWLSVFLFWFGEQVDGFSPQEKQAQWFHSTTSFDDAIRQQFGPLVEDALAGELGEWDTEPHGRLALIILLDQFTRNIYRKTEQAFAGDSRALELSRRSIREYPDGTFSFSERQFLYMPLMHSESLEDQELSITQLKKLKEDVPESHKEAVERSIKYAQDHRDIIEEFGRFPYRNKALGRTNTAEEEHFLRNLKSSYGQ